MAAFRDNICGGGDGFMALPSWQLHLPRAVSIFLFVCMVVFLGVFGTAEGLIIKNAVQRPEKNADYLVVLGARVNGTRITLNLKFALM